MFPMPVVVQSKRRNGRCRILAAGKDLGKIYSIYGAPSCDFYFQTPGYSRSCFILKFLRCTLLPFILLHPIAQHRLQIQ